MASHSFQLVMRTGPNPGKVFELTKGEVYIGRDISNDVVINDAEISRKHARLISQSGGYLLEDLGSTNGSFVNGQRLMGPHLLRTGELIMLGENVSLAFESTAFDADATVVGSSMPAYSPPERSPQETYIPPAPPPSPPAQTPQPAYTGQIPQSPAEPYYDPMPEEKESNRTLIYAGCGCLIVLLCILVVGGFAFDSLNLYCTPPFDAFFPCG